MQLVSIVMAEELLRRGYAVDFIVDEATGSARKKVPSAVRILERGRVSKTRAWRTLFKRLPGLAMRLSYPALLGQRAPVTPRQLLALIDYLRTEPPAALITTTPGRALQAVWAATVVASATQIIVTERNPPSQIIKANQSRAKDRCYWRRRCRLIRATYPQAHAVVAVSEDLGHDLARTTGLSRSAIQTIYNPVVAPNLSALIDEPVNHPWFSAGQPPLILAAGRLVAQKDFATLIDAFALVAAKREAHLMILGEGEQRASLAAQIESLRLNARVALPGWHDNPYAAMTRADVFVLSSISEGLPGSLIQAIACGCPAVATDCPNGPREILADGRYGELVAMRDAPTMAAAIIRTLDAPPDRTQLRKRGADFTVGRIVDQYERLFDAR